jgi:hypothetical protein
MVILELTGKMLRAVFWIMLPFRMIVDRRYSGAMEAVPTPETSVDNHSTWQYNPEDSSEHHTRRRENLKSQLERCNSYQNTRFPYATFAPLRAECCQLV